VSSRLLTPATGRTSSSPGAEVRGFVSGPGDGRPLVPALT
jgi:hypothetical protein